MTLEGLPVVLHADKEHDRLRLAVLVILAAIFVITFVGLRAFLRSRPPGPWVEYAFALSCVSALPIALGLSALAEYWMKRNWHSGRSVSLDEVGLKVQLQDGQPEYYDWSKPIYTIRWYFSMRGFPKGGRERRVPGGWYCLACQLQQDEGRLVIFSFMPERKARRYLEQWTFKQLKPSEFHNPNPLRRRFGAPKRPEIPTKVLTGKEGHFWLAERRRWDQGLELVEQDFDIFMNRLAAHKVD